MGYVRSPADPEGKEGRLMLFPLKARVKGDVQRLRAFGNAINPVLAAEVVRAWMECRP
jgi:site-specific DNA-cytosine methylase